MQKEAEEEAEVSHDCHLHERLLSPGVVVLSIQISGSCFFQNWTQKRGSGSTV